MANDLTAIAPRILAAGLKVARQNAITSRLVNRDYDVSAAQVGDVIDIPISSAVASRPVVPAQVPPAPVNSNPTKAIIEFDFWEEAPVFLTDKDLAAVGKGLIPMQLAEGVKSLINSLDAYVLNKIKLGVFNATGTAGTTPFATTTDAYNEARRLLNIELAPMSDRRVILDPSAEAKATALAVFQHADQRGDQGGIIEGMIGRKLGADWHMNQNVPVHTAGVPGGTPAGTAALGASVVAVASGAVSGTFLAGDIISFANHTQTYVVTENLTLSGGAGNLEIFPPLRAAVSGSVITTRASHTANVLMHRDCFSLATRTLKPSETGLGVITEVAVDPMTGIAMRLEISRQHRQTQYAFDILAGGVVSRPEWGTIIMG